jgi:hypothetical protein
VSVLEVVIRVSAQLVSRRARRTRSKQTRLAE